jgi:FAD/FMN-containing dehydrogenase
MGLTGTIVEATIRLTKVETGWIKQRTIVAPNFGAAMKALSASEDATFSVAWIDCLARGPALGRSLVYCGEHATRRDIEGVAPARHLFPSARSGRLSVPFDPPPFVLNRASVTAFNALYYRWGAAKSHEPILLAWEPFFFPLDGIRDWNRIYGRRGFVQHQCVIPTAAAEPALAEILERISRRGEASFLAVLKSLSAGAGLLSFPIPGLTLALDFPLTTGTFEFLDEIDQLVAAAGGRVYLAKDARQSRQTFERGYPSLSAFRDVRRAVKAEGHMVSHLSRRLGI